MNLKELFINDKEFQKKIIFIHFAKSEDYIASKADDLLYALDFSRGGVNDDAAPAVSCSSSSGLYSLFSKDLRASTSIPRTLLN